MNKELFAILDAMAYKVDKYGNVEADPKRQDIDKARELATAYVKAHRDEFGEFEAFGPDAKGIEATVNAAEVFRDIYHRTGMESQREAWARAEAWHLHTWDPQDIGGEAQPRLRLTN